MYSESDSNLPTFMPQFGRAAQILLEQESETQQGLEQDVDVHQNLGPGIHIQQESEPKIPRPQEIDFHTETNTCLNFGVDKYITYS